MRFSWSIAFLMLAGLVSTATADPRPVVTSKAAGVSLSPDYAVQPANGNVLYHGKGVSGTNPLYEARAGGNVIITINGFSFTGSASFFGSGGGGGGFIGARFVSDDGSAKPQIVTFTSDGVVAGGPYRDTDSDGDGTLDATRSPAFANNGAVVFKSFRNTTGKSSPLLMYQTPGGVTGTLPPDWYSNATDLSRPAIRPDGSEICVVVERSDATGVHQALCVGAPTANQPITINGSSFRYANPQMDATGGIACVETDSVGDRHVVYTTREAGSGIATGRRQYQPVRLAGDSGDLTFSLESSGDRLAICDGSAISIVSPHDSASGLPVGAAPAAPSPVVSLGDMVGGQTITSLALSPQAFSAPGNELMFFATLSSGDSGIFAVALPEPATLGLVATLVPMFARRRR